MGSFVVPASASETREFDESPLSRSVKDTYLVGYPPRFGHFSCMLAETSGPGSKYGLVACRTGLEIGILASDLRTLVSQCLAGDQRAMTELVARYQNQVFGLCYRMLGNRHDAEDATQETFVRVLRSLARWDAERDFEPWLFAIAGNRCRTALAARGRRKEYALDPIPEPAAWDEQSEGALAEEVRRGLARLRDEYREVFVLFHEQGLSYDQIAEAVERPLGTVKIWIHRARKELTRYLVQRGVVTESNNAVRPV